MKKLVTLLLFAASLCCAQNGRFDSQATTTIGVGAQLPVVALPGAAIAFYSCSGPLITTCTALATTYSAVSGGSACATNAQVVLAGTSTCVALADAQGNFGAWLPTNTTYGYAYTITTVGGTFGPYPITIGNTGGGGQGTVNSFSVGSFPSYLTPNVTNPDTTPQLSVTGSTIPVGSGGTGVVSIPSGDVPVGNGTAAVTFVADSTSVNGQTCPLGGSCTVSNATSNDNITCASSIAFSGTTNTQTLNLSCNVTSSTIPNGTAGACTVIQVTQTGSNTLAWPATVTNPFTPTSGTQAQQFCWNPLFNQWVGDMNGAILANPSSNQLITQPAHTTLAVTNLNDEYWMTVGGDWCIKSNAIIATVPAATQYIIRIPPGTYPDCTVTVTIDPFYGSIIGAGEASTSLRARTSNISILEQQASFQQAYGGQFSGFNLAGDGSANQIGIKTGNVINTYMNYVNLSNFSGAGSTGMLVYNSSGAYYERNIITNSQIVNSTCGITYNTDGSSGTSSMENAVMQFSINSNSGQSGLCVLAGNIRNSTVAMQGNIINGGTAITVAAGASMYPSDFSIFLDSAASCAVFNTGTGVRVGGNGSVWAPNCSVNSGPGSVEILPFYNFGFGSISNYQGSGQTANVNLLSTGGQNDAPQDVFLGSLTGSNVGGWIMGLQNTTFENAFQIVEGCSSSGAASCTTVFTFTAGGDLIAADSITSLGSITSEGLPSQPCVGTNSSGTFVAGTCGTITGVTAGTGLTGGGSSGALTIGLLTPVSVANGGTGTSSPGIVAGSGVTVTGTWPNQTVAATGGGGGTTILTGTATSPLPPSAGTQPSGTCFTATASVAGAVVGHPAWIGNSSGAPVGANDDLFVIGAGVTSSGTVTIQWCSTSSLASFSTQTYNVATF